MYVAVGEIAVWEVPGAHPSSPTSTGHQESGNPGFLEDQQIPLHVCNDVGSIS